jgi:LuxR family transcriptional regulator, maltose regulon positive regulatory protein
VSRYALFGRLAEAGRVVHISAPAGSGKTVLMRSWIAGAGLAPHAAWVALDGQERDPGTFWISLADALRGTAAGSALVRPLTAAPDLDGWAVVERLLTDLAPLQDRLWLMIDDAHLLDSAEVRAQLELLLLRAPQNLRFFLARRLVDFPVVAEEAQRLLALTEGAGAARLGLGEDLRAAAFISLGIAEMWVLRFEEGKRHLEQGVTLARRIGRPYLELHGLAHGAHGMLLFRPGLSQAEWSWQAIELAEQHGWGEEPLAGMAYAQVSFVLLYQGRLDEAEPWLERAEQALAELGEDERASAEMRTAAAALRLATGDPQGAADALAPLLDGSVRGVRRLRMVTALLLEAQARDALGDQVAADRGLERALDITESDGMLLPFLLDPAPALLERHRQYHTAHPALISQILDLLPTPTRPEPPGGKAGWARSGGLAEQLTDSETRVLRYLPTHLTVQEIADEVFLSVNTVSTHKQRLYTKLGVHSRHEAVERARALGLLAPSARGAKA